MWNAFHPLTWSKSIKTSKKLIMLNQPVTGSIIDLLLGSLVNLCMSVSVGLSHYLSDQLRCKMSLVMRKPFMPYGNNKGADQPAHLRSLISTFVVCCPDSIIPLVSIHEMSCRYLASVAAQACLSLPWLKTLRDRFSLDVAQMTEVLSFCVIVLCIEVFQC